MDKNINHFEARWEEINKIIHAMKNALMTIHLIEKKLIECRTTLGVGIDETYKAINEMMEATNDKVLNGKVGEEKVKEAGTAQGEKGQEKG